MSNRIDRSKSARKRLKHEYGEIKNWRVLAGNYRVTSGVMYKFVVDGIEPKDQELRYRLEIDIRPKPEWLKLAVRFLAAHEKAERITAPRVYTRNRKMIVLEPEV